MTFQNKHAIIKQVKYEISFYIVKHYFNLLISKKLLTKCKIISRKEKYWENNIKIIKTLNMFSIEKPLWRLTELSCKLNLSNSKKGR